MLHLARLTCVLVLLGTLSIAATASAQRGPPPVEVATPLVEWIVDWDEYTGRFVAVDRVELRARVSGYLNEITFDDGQIVSEGDTLFRIDPRVFEAEVARLEAELNAARAEQTFADAELARAEELISRGNISASTRDQRLAEKLRADAAVAITEAQLREARLNLEFTTITAPFGGRISDARVDIGNLVSNGETVLATIVRTDPIHLVFTASEADFLAYSRLNASGDRPGSRENPNPVEARLIDETGWPHKGRMNFVANELDTNAGTITGRAIFENADNFLTPGLFARLRLIGSGEYEATLIPPAAVLSDQARKIVYVLDENNVVEIRVVKPGDRYRGLQVIREGLSPEDRVIVNGVQRARPGQPVTPETVEIEFAEEDVTAVSLSNGG